MVQKEVLRYEVNELFLREGWPLPSVLGLCGRGLCSGGGATGVAPVRSC